MHILINFEGKNKLSIGNFGRGGVHGHHLATAAVGNAGLGFKFFKASST
jgi:hypothetical protein